MPSPEKLLKDLGITLPKPAKPVASYEGFIRTGNLVFVSGQIPVVDGKVAVIGKLGGGVSLEDGQKAARLCAINVLAQLNEATGHDLSKVTRVVKVTGFVAATPDYTDVPKVVNGASDLFAAVFGDRGKHARAAVGVAVLPLDSAVEVEAIVEVE
ncbi:RidA family protein [Aestuariivirga sp.]|uniref:RidA family protein n=1 Tax=Aestuariivirga sp. TaxID=2650926 RepID=UPI0039E3CCC1